MYSNEAKTSKYHAIDIALKKENLSKLTTSKELFVAFQKSLNERSEPISMTAFFDEIASEFPAYHQHDYQRRYLVHKRLIVEGGLIPEMLAEFDPELLAIAAECRHMEPDLLRLIMRRLYADLRHGESYQQLMDT